MDVDGVVVLIDGTKPSDTKNSAGSTTIKHHFKIDDDDIIELDISFD